MTGAVAGSGRPAPPPDLALVAQIVRRAGVHCVLERPDGGAATLLAEPREAGDRVHWTVRATLHDARGGRAGHACVGPNHAHGRAVRLRDPDERHLAALIVAQALRADPDEALTADEVDVLGLLPCGSAARGSGRAR
jgi:hypothetical protein